MLKKIFIGLFILFNLVIAKEISFDWNKNETILLMDTYIKITPNYDQYNIEIKKLSQTLRKANPELAEFPSFRDTKSIYFEMLKLQKLDAKNNQHLKKLEPTTIQNEVWDEYNKDLKKLKNDVIELRKEKYKE